ncbi:MAG: ABC transporter permease [Muribaculaceae bacterium]|nr:ABC transporter permease [Muribaculaceae bacterium]
MKNPVFDIDNWREIGSTLSRNKTRTLLTAFGIFWGTFMLAILWGGAAGAEGMLMRNFSGFATNMGFMLSGRTTISYRGFNKGYAWQLKDADVSAFRRYIPILDSSSSVASVMVTASYGSKSSSTVVNGVEGGYAGIQLPVMYEGRFINESDVAHRRKVAVIGRNLARELFGDASPLGKFLSLGGLYYQVVGVAGQTSEMSLSGARLDDSVTMPFTTLRSTFSKGDDVGFFVFTAKKGYTPTDMRQDMERILRVHHPIHPDDHNAMYFKDLGEEFSKVETLFTGFSLIALFVGAGTLLAGIIGVGNIMWIIVKERTQEIGVRRAIGAKPRDIIVQVLSEGMVLTAVAGLAGLCLATIVLGVADHLTYSPAVGHAGFELHFSHAVFIMVAFMVLGTAAGFIPAVKAMRIKPIEALNSK